MFVWWWVWTTDMFPHLLHTKKFLDWRFGRQEGEDIDSTAAGASTGTGTGAGGGGSWPMSRGRRPGRLRAVSRRHKTMTSTLKSSTMSTVKSPTVKSPTVKSGHWRSAQHRTTLPERHRQSRSHNDDN